MDHKTEIFDLPTENNKLAIYNVFPRNYEPREGENHIFGAMAEDFARIKEMGFDAVYINPLTATGAYPKSDENKMGSMYSTHDVEHISPSFYRGEDKRLFDDDGNIAPAGQAIKDMCNAAKEAGLIPMFDLVKGHLSMDSPYIELARADGLEIIDSYPSNGHYNIHNLDEHYQPITDPETGHTFAPNHIWDDVVKFRFDTPYAEEKPNNRWIMDHIFAPYVEHMAELGFEGIRIDAPMNVPKEIMEEAIATFTEKYRDLNEVDTSWQPVIYPEFLGYVRPEALSSLDDYVIANTLITSALFHPNEHERPHADANIYNDISNQQDHWLVQEIAERRNVSGAAIAPVSSHDEERLAVRMRETLEAREHVPEGEDFERTLARAIRIDMAFATFIADGWMLTSGDEFLSESAYATLEGNLVDDYKAQHDGAVLGTDASGEPITLPAEVYAQLMQAPIDDLVEYVTEGEETQSFEFRKGVFFEKPVWQYHQGIVDVEAGREGEFVLGDDAAGNPVILPKPVYTQISNMLIGDSYLVELEGTPYSFHMQEDGSIRFAEKQILKERLMQVIPQDKMHDLVRENSEMLDDPDSLVGYIKDLNTALKERPLFQFRTTDRRPDAELQDPKELRTMLQFSDHDPDVMYFSTVEFFPHTEKAPIVHEVNAVNVSPEARDVTLTQEQMQQEVYDKFPIEQGTELPDIYLVGAFEHKAQQREQAAEAIELSDVATEPPVSQVEGRRSSPGTILGPEQFISTDEPNRSSFGI